MRLPRISEDLIRSQTSAMSRDTGYSIADYHEKFCTEQPELVSLLSGMVANYKNKYLNIPHPIPVEMILSHMTDLVAFSYKLISIAVEAKDLDEYANHSIS